ncbi:MAG TPA: ABC transporter ATP-binding protein [Clostridia bacterium]|nr:ABC transporter ATP-binding protein [Clostridia bacterium]
MKRILRYLTPFLGGFLIALVLLFSQAMADLNLPNYMSNIVNVGIQQSGVEHAAPDAISVEGMDLMRTFMSDRERELMEASYTLVSSSEQDKNGNVYSELYSNASEQLYIKNNTDENTQLDLDTAFENATWTLVTYMREMSSQTGQAESSGMDTETSLRGVNLTMLYKIQPQLDLIPREDILKAHDEAVNDDQGIKSQSGIMLAKLFYEELGADISAMQTNYILRIGLLMLGIAFLSGTATVLVSLISSRISAGVARNIRKDVFVRIESFSNAEFDKFSTASLITRCTNDITQIQMLIMMGIRLVCYAPILAIGGIIMAVDKSVSMSWIIAAAVVLLVGVVLVVTSIVLPKFKSIQKLVDKLNLVSRENLNGIMVIRAFGTQAHETSRFEEANGDLTRINLFVNRIMVYMMPLMSLIMNGVAALVVWVGARQIADSAMQIGDMMAFIQYAMQVIMSFLMISMMFIFVPRALVSVSRIKEVLNTDPSIVDAKDLKPFDESRNGLVEFQNVYFRYNNAEDDTLSNIDFTAKPGETTAIIGSTGSGKSTIASLLLRFYDVTSGRILVNGRDIREVSQHELRQKIGYVPQKSMLLSGSLEDNLRYGRPDATDEEIRTVAKVAQADGFIHDLPEGYAYEIAQGGTNVSGGQKQRLSIARALAKNPDIFVFDDSFSALDFKTDVTLRKALKEYTGYSTVIIVTQRVSTIMHAEQILVLDMGKIVGRGTHSELLKTCPEYYEIASSQLSQEELA